MGQSSTKKKETKPEGKVIERVERVATGTTERPNMNHLATVREDFYSYKSNNAHLKISSSPPPKEMNAIKSQENPSCTSWEGELTNNEIALLPKKQATDAENISELDHEVYPTSIRKDTKTCLNPSIPAFQNFSRGGLKVTDVENYDDNPWREVSNLPSHQYYLPSNGISRLKNVSLVDKKYESELPAKCSQKNPVFSMQNDSAMPSLSSKYVRNSDFGEVKKEDPSMENQREMSFKSPKPTSQTIFVQNTYGQKCHTEDVLGKSDVHKERNELENTSSIQPGGTKTIVAFNDIKENKGLKPNENGTFTTLSDNATDIPHFPLSSLKRKPLAPRTWEVKLESDMKEQNLLNQNENLELSKNSISSDPFEVSQNDGRQKSAIDKIVQQADINYSEESNQSSDNSGYYTKTKALPSGSSKANKRIFMFRDMKEEEEQSIENQTKKSPQQFRKNFQTNHREDVCVENCSGKVDSEIEKWHACTKVENTEEKADLIQNEHTKNPIATMGGNLKQNVKQSKESNPSKTQEQCNSACKTNEFSKLKTDQLIQRSEETKIKTLRGIQSLCESKVNLTNGKYRVSSVSQDEYKLKTMQFPGERAVTCSHTMRKESKDSSKYSAHNSFQQDEKMKVSAGENKDIDKKCKKAEINGEEKSHLRKSDDKPGKSLINVAHPDCGQSCDGASKISGNTAVVKIPTQKEKNIIQDKGKIKTNVDSGNRMETKVKQHGEKNTSKSIISCKTASTGCVFEHNSDLRPNQPTHRKEDTNKKCKTKMETSGEQKESIKGNGHTMSARRKDIPAHKKESKQKQVSATKIDQRPNSILLKEKEPRLGNDSVGYDSFQKAGIIDNTCNEIKENDTKHNDSRGEECTDKKMQIIVNPPKGNAQANVDQVVYNRYYDEEVSKINGSPTSAKYQVSSKKAAVVQHVSTKRIAPNIEEIKETKSKQLEKRKGASKGTLTSNSANDEQKTKFSNLETKEYGRRIDETGAKSEMTIKRPCMQNTILKAKVEEISQRLNFSENMAKQKRISKQSTESLKDGVLIEESKRDNMYKLVDEPEAHGRVKEDKERDNTTGDTDKYGGCKGGKCSLTPREKLSVHLAHSNFGQNCNKDALNRILIISKKLEVENDLWSHLIGIVSDVKFRVKTFETNSINKTTTVVIDFKTDADAMTFERCLKENDKKLGFDYQFKKETPEEEKPKTMVMDINKKLQNMREKIVKVLKSHQEKIKKFEKETQNLNKVSTSSRKKKKFIDLSLHEQREAQRKALNDKSRELNQQQSEFQSCLSKVIQKIESFEAQHVEQKEIDNLMKRFEIECTRLEQALHIYAKRTKIVNTILENQVSIILGETGSGKSTQITQYIFESELSSLGKIICTQPRKVAAISLAERVAFELKTKVGHLVGYQAGMKSKLSNQSKMLYMTDHMLLNECLKDPLLMDFSCVVIDEAHERSVYTDLLLGMIKKCLPQRPELRVVVTSATIDPDVFVQYFGGPDICPVLRVSGRMFPVDIEWLSMSTDADVADNYEIRAIEKAAEIHRTEPPGDILVFLTSQVEIEQCAEKINVLLRGKKDHWILPLHGKLHTEEQNLVFRESPKGKRKIVLATNVAETSVTIPGVKYVVDTGAVKELSYDPRKKISALRVVKVTKSSADQRKGRAGRTGPGKCYRLYSKEDYNNMYPTSIPEILKIHLGHAILKLLQLDVDPLEFDFVQAPEKVSMENAFQHLNKLGAIENGKISPLGRWIAKLPFEPSLGVLVHDAIDRNVGLEGIIIAASCTVPGSLFYRGGTASQKELSDKLKIQFCHKYGDHFTNLSVFKEWHRVPARQRGKWCRDNSINGKAMRNIDDATEELLYTLKRDLSINIEHKFTDAADGDRILQKLLFKSFQCNVCYFLGHEKAGYFFIDKGQQVIVHPSSAFQSLASYPNWVIVERVMQTSRDFALNITAVADEDVEEALEDGSLDFDIGDVERRKVTQVLTEYVGVQVHREFVGPRYSKVKAMQENLALKCKDSVFVVDANRDRGEISIYAPIDDQDISFQTLQSAINPIREKVRNETVEHPLLPEFQSVRISIGAGGQIHDLLYQDEYKNVFIFGDAEAFNSDDEMVHWFENFGSIRSFIPKSPNNNNPKYLGQIVYEKSEFAKTAVMATRKRTFEISAKPPKGIGKSEEADLLKARLTWRRRKSKGYGFVEIHHRDKMDEVIRSKLFNNLLVGGKRVKVMRSKNNPDKELHVAGLGELVDEDVLRESFLNTFDISENDIVKIVVIRERVNTTPEMLYSLKTRLESQFTQETDIEKNSFTVTVIEPHPAAYTYEAFVTFKNPEEGFEACSRLHNRISIGNDPVTITPEIHTRIFVLAPVYKRVEENLEKYRKKIQNEDSGRQLTVTVLKNGNYMIDIDADCIESMVHTRNKVQRMLQGETIDLEKIPALRYLFTSDGQEKVEKVMRKTSTLILLDHRNTSVSVHGQSENRRIAIEKVRKYVEKMSSSKFRVIDLKGESKPPGLMKTVVLMHSVDLSGLKKESGLSTVELDHKNHRIKMLGSDEAVDKAVQSIEEITERLRKNTATLVSDQPECGICLCEIADSEIYRLESCGHPYCGDCIKMHIESAIRSKEFPLKCVHIDCGMLWAWKDFVNMTKHGFCRFQNILNSSVSSFVTENKDKVRYCITPDCPMVYKVSKVGGRIVCCVCRTSMCNKCHVEYHSGISCAMYQMENGNDESRLGEWMRRDPKNRKLCPVCFAGIEKNGGCQYMQCRDCKSHTCWRCMKNFKTSEECYGHMRKEHGSFN
ncbi:uncharacterized protein LOC133204660 [Saccostrea echinata]|uniref:uncharacterized protein LOC133204660 n=1 Tax=Saccostrea echinata TaxID=191078 RepID=UPI002A83E545|nr:uncharacterized protein LOC133204660 [Saccostrea echinata]